MLVPKTSQLKSWHQLLGKLVMLSTKCIQKKLLTLLGFENAQLYVYFCERVVTIYDKQLVHRSRQSHTSLWSVLYRNDTWVAEAEKRVWWFVCPNI